MHTTLLIVYLLKKYQKYLTMKDYKDKNIQISDFIKQLKAKDEQISRLRKQLDQYKNIERLESSWSFSMRSQSIQHQKMIINSEDESFQNNKSYSTIQFGNMMTEKLIEQNKNNLLREIHAQKCNIINQSQDISQDIYSSTTARDLSQQGRTNINLNQDISSTTFKTKFKLQNQSNDGIQGSSVLPILNDFSINDSFILVGMELEEDTLHLQLDCNCIQKQINILEQEGYQLQNKYQILKIENAKKILQKQRQLQDKKYHLDKVNRKQFNLNQTGAYQKGSAKEVHKK